MGLLVPAQREDQRQVVEHNQADWQQEDADAQAVSQVGPEETGPPSNQDEVDGAHEHAVLLRAADIDNNVGSSSTGRN